MLLLGIESSTMVGSVALLDDGRLVGEHTLNLKRTHSERLMAAVQQLLEASGVVPKDLSGICVATGPGSFTGVRIGVTTAKALAWSLGVPLVAVGSLEALARAVFIPVPQAVIAPSVAAKGTLVFAAAYWADGGYGVAIEPAAMDVKEYCHALRSLGRSVVPLGDGFIQHRSEFGGLQDSGLLVEVPDCYCLPRAVPVARLGMERLMAGSTADPKTLTPTYLRLPEAEVNWTLRHGDGCEGGCR